MTFGVLLPLPHTFPWRLASLSKETTCFYLQFIGEVTEPAGSFTTACEVCSGSTTVSNSEVPSIFYLRFFFIVFSSFGQKWRNQLVYSLLPVRCVREVPQFQTLRCHRFSIWDFSSLCSVPSDKLICSVLNHGGGLSAACYEWRRHEVLG